MIYELYVIYDRISGQYSIPWAQLNQSAAKRHFMYVVNKSEQFEPSDFDLFYVGTFDQESGKVAAQVNPQFIMRGEARV